MIETEEGFARCGLRRLPAANIRFGTRKISTNHVSVVGGRWQVPSPSGKMKRGSNAQAANPNHQPGLDLQPP